MYARISESGSTRWFKASPGCDVEGYHNLYGPAVKWFFCIDEYFIDNVEYNTYLEYIVAVTEYKQNH